MLRRVLRGARRRLLDVEVARRTRQARSSAALEKGRQRLLSDPATPPRHRDLLARVSLTVADDDLMFGGYIEEYLRVGLSAIDAIDRAVATRTDPVVRRVLDLPCGHGRVLRFLRARFADAAITACDIDEAAVAFCARSFGVAGAASTPRLDDLHLDGSFDLIWCGSLATHLDAEAVDALLRAFRRHLEPSGVAVFSTHGDYVVDRLPRREFDYGLSEEQEQGLVAGYRADGFGYTEYHGHDGYGVSVSSPEWVGARVAAAGLEIVSFSPRGWADHHDVHVCRPSA